LVRGETKPINRKGPDTLKVSGLFLCMKTIIGTVVNLKAGTGYWDLTHFPWGGSFKRLKQDSQATVIRIADTYDSGAPRKVVANFSGETREIGITL
jgi:hypothetical protein